MPDEPSDPLRVDFVTGVTPDKWARTWAERRPDDPLALTPVDDGEAEARLRSGASTLSLLRLPVDRDGLHVIPLYEEAPVVVVAKEHAAAAFDELDVTDLADEVLLQPADTVPAWRDAASPEVRERAAAMPSMSVVDAIAVAATGSGFVVVPLSVARVHHRKDVVHRPVTGVDGSRVGLAWRVDDEEPRIEDFIGVVRGRTERSSRGRAAENPAPESGSGAAKGTGRHTGSERGGSARRSGGRALPHRGAAPRRGRGRKGR
ncbi:LysR substrate binding domain-containing protein [Humibacillus xanthopallidus]|uniref:LysR substrate binding domain-containing protein n=1 Tax=Humibacillus xanthopallidus TaxID=412689 RepID=A0A543PV96_9MICO|nr:LysR substrate-binding domain-containing protein [Humibacillus xanthopallidus]TQN47991.1 LysR substrate binding domain-containing protein [Humibacillus xanthopallidus]